MSSDLFFNLQDNYMGDLNVRSMLNNMFERSNRRRSMVHHTGSRQVLMDIRDQYIPVQVYNRPALSELSTSHHVVTNRPSNIHNIILDNESEHATTFLAADEDIIQQRILLDRSLNMADEATSPGSSRPSTPILEGANTEVNNNIMTTPVDETNSKRKKRRSSLLRLTKSPVPMKPKLNKKRTERLSL